MWRPAIPEDEPAVVALYLALNAEDPGTIPPDPARPRRTLALFRSAPDRGRCVVLEEGGSVAGYALLVPYWSNELGGVVCSLDELYVAPSARRRGRAGELLDLLAAGALGWPDSVALHLTVSPSNERARALYARHGFRAVPDTPMWRWVETRSA